MRSLRYLCLVLACAVICCALFSVSTYAVEGDSVPVSGYFIFNQDITSILEGEFIYLDFECNGKLYNGIYTNVEEGSIKYWRGSLYFDEVWTVSDHWVDPVYQTLDLGFTVQHIDNLAYNRLVSVGAFLPRLVEAKDFDNLFLAYTNQINLPFVVVVLAGAAGVSVGLVFLWWGARKVSGSVMKAFKKGKIRI